MIQQGAQEVLIMLQSAAPAQGIRSPAMGRVLKMRVCVCVCKSRRHRETDRKPFCFCWQSHSSFSLGEAIGLSKWGQEELKILGGMLNIHLKPTSLSTACSCTVPHIENVCCFFLEFIWSITESQRRLELSPMEQISIFFLSLYDFSVLFLSPFVCWG